LTSIPARRVSSSPTASALLILLPSLVLLGGIGALVLSMPLTLTPQEQGLLAVVATLPLVTPALVRLVGKRWDAVLGGAVWMLCALSIITVARVTPDLLSRQLLWIALGWTGLLALLAVPDVLGKLRRYHYTWLACGLLLAVVTLIYGEDLNGSGIRLWLRIGPLTVQPSEVLRVLLVVFLAAYLDERRDLLTAASMRWGPLRLPPLPYMAPLLAMAGLSMLILVFQRDLGPALLYFSSAVAMIYLATGQRSYLLFGLALFGAAGVVGYAVSGHVYERFAIWRDPWSDPEGLGYQSLQALGGLASGGLLGSGPGYGYPTLIPAAQTDYPIVVIGEEWGFVALAAVILLYAIVTLRILALAAIDARDGFGQLLGAGLGVSLGLQVFIVVAGALRIIPVAGITSPFLSYGGSSMLIGWAAIALITAIASQPRREAGARGTAEDGRLAARVSASPAPAS
jgi:cell division protein FtsW (lipid II flippase)